MHNIFYFKRENGDPHTCQYDENFDDAKLIDVKDYTIGTSNIFGDLTYTRHAYNLEEVEYFTGILH